MRENFTPVTSNKRILPLIATFIFALLLTSLLGGCAIFGAPTELDETKGWPAEKIYAAGEEQMTERNYEKALKYYKVLETRFPHGVYAAQAQLDSAYAYYKQQDPIQCVAAADRFIKLHPNHPNVDYAYYIKGLAAFNERGIVEKVTQQQISDRDPKTLRVSFESFKELTERYPKSRYYKDSVQRMTYLVNMLAEHEIDVARYYMKRQAYLSALNRAKYVLEYYPNSTSVEEALVIQISAYDNMGMEDLKNDVLRVLKTNYPQNPMITGKIQQDEKVWWKFWESLY